MGEYVRWVWEGKLARASRPGYNSEHVSLQDIENWMEAVRNMQVRSIICLLNEDQLRFYQDIPGGLLAYYREQGFQVINIPVTDPHHNPLVGYAELEAARETVYAQYQELPKPVLIHCSAGLQRTGRIVEVIEEREARHGNRE